jgi:putative transposase
MAKGKKHTPEQIVTILRRIDGGESAQVVSRGLNISEATLHRWKQQYGAIEIDELKELNALRDKNARLKRIVADQVLNIQVLKEVNSKRTYRRPDYPKSQCVRRGPKQRLGTGADLQEKSDPANRHALRQLQPWRKPCGSTSMASPIRGAGSHRRRSPLIKPCWIGPKARRFSWT